MAMHPAGDGGVNARSHALRRPCADMRTQSQDMMDKSKKFKWGAKKLNAMACLRRVPYHRVRIVRGRPRPWPPVLSGRLAHRSHHLQEALRRYAPVIGGGALLAIVFYYKFLM